MPPKVPSVLQCDSAQVFENELGSIRNVLAKPETEDSWDAIGRGIQQLTALSRGGACDLPDDLVGALRSLSRPIITSINSERTALSGHAIELLSVVASGLGPGFDPIVPVFLPVLLTLCTRTSKVFVSRARACILTIIEETRLPAILPYLSESTKSKSVSLRLIATEGTLACLNAFNPADVEKEIRAREVEAIIKATARDASADVRKTSRSIFEGYKVLLPGRVDHFIAPLTPTMRRYLDVKSNAAAQPNPTSRPTSSQSSHSARSRPLPALSSSQPHLQAAAPSSVHPVVRSLSSSATATGAPRKLAPERRAVADPSAHRNGDARAMPPPEFVPVRSAAPRAGPSRAQVDPAGAGVGAHGASSFGVHQRQGSGAPLKPQRSMVSLTDGHGVPRTRYAPVRTVSGGVPARNATDSASQSQPTVPVRGARRVLVTEQEHAPARDVGTRAHGATAAPASTTAADSAATTKEQPAPVRSAKLAPPAAHAAIKTTLVRTAEVAKPIPAPRRPAVPAHAPAVAACGTAAPKTREPPAKPTANVRGKPPPFAPHKSSSKPAAPTASSSASAAGPSGRSVTQPTASQLARTKALAAEKEKAKDAKPQWGRPAGSAQAGTSGGTATGIRRGVSVSVPAAKSTGDLRKPVTKPVGGFKPAQTRVKPEVVPLPPSPELKPQPVEAAPEDVQARIDTEQAVATSAKEAAEGQAAAEEVAHAHEAIEIDAAMVPLPLSPELEQDEAAAEEEVQQSAPEVEVEEPAEPLTNTDDSDAPVPAPVEKTIFMDRASAQSLQPFADATPAMATPPTLQIPASVVEGTPITSLLSSIQQGFIHSPYTPLSPPQFYLERQAAANGLLTAPLARQQANGTVPQSMFGAFGIMGLVPKASSDGQSRPVLSDVETN